MPFCLISRNIHPRYVIFNDTRVNNFDTKDTHREKAPSNKVPSLRKVQIWAFGLMVH